jgi:predicted Zn-dependent peptidase
MKMANSNYERMNQEFYRTKLDNGLTLLFEKRERPVASIMITSRFGGLYEPAEYKGIAHFIEHGVFKGTRRRDQLRLKKDIESKGGIFNASTEEQMTSYYVKIPSNHIELGLDVLLDMVLNPLFEPEEIEKERKVIFEEIKMRKDLPEMYVIDKIKELLYRGDFSLPLAGTFDSLKNIKRQNILDYHALYTNNNLIITFVGKSDYTDFIKLVQDRFKRNTCFRNLPYKKIYRKNQQIIEKRQELQQAHLVIGIHMPSLTEKQRYAAEVIDCILGSGMSSRLFQEIREKRGLAYATKTYLQQERDYGHLIAYAGIKPDKVKEVREIILKEIKKLKKLKKDELEEAKEQLIGAYRVKNENSINTLFSLAIEEIAGNAERFYKYPEMISRVKLDDVKRLASIKNYSFLGLVPK